MRVSGGLRWCAHTYEGTWECLRRFARVCKGWGDCGKRGCGLILLKWPGGSRPLPPTLVPLYMEACWASVSPPAR